MRRLVWMSMAASALMAASGAHAANVCVKPLVPACMNDGTTFVSADKMQTCQFEVKDYADKTMAYLNCLSEEHQATGQELTRNIERFNCRLSGRQNCG